MVSTVSHTAFNKYVLPSDMRDSPNVCVLSNEPYDGSLGSIEDILEMTATLAAQAAPPLAPTSVNWRPPTIATTVDAHGVRKFTLYDESKVEARVVNVVAGRELPY